MRVIKFRGKSVDSGEWTYGDLIQLHNGKSYIVDNRFGACIDAEGNFINTEYPFVVEVDSRTVGQFTGLKDISDTEIYECDILKISCNDNEDMVYVKWDSKEAAFKGYKEDCPDTPKWMLSGSDKCMEVIGNIYKDSELLAL